MNGRGSLPGPPRVEVIVKLLVERVLGWFAVLQDDIGHVAHDERREDEERDDDTGSDTEMGADVVEGGVGGGEDDGGGHFFPRAGCSPVGRLGTCGFVG